MSENPLRRTRIDFERVFKRREYKNTSEGKRGLKMDEREVDFFEKKARGVVEQVLSLADYIGTFTPQQKKAVEHFVKMGFWEGVNAEVSASVDFKKEP